MRCLCCATPQEERSREDLPGRNQNCGDPGQKSVCFLPWRIDNFQERRDALVEGLNRIGLKVFPPQATFYLWADVPPGYTSQNFCIKALEKTRVWMIPGSVYGQDVEGYLRIALTHPAERLKEAVRRLEKFMGKRTSSRLTGSMKGSNFIS